MNINTTQLYKSMWFEELNTLNKLSTILHRLSINPEVQEVLEYIFKKYENIDDISNIYEIDLSDDNLKKGCMVICYLDKDNNKKYIWEYYSNWVKIREQLKTKDNGKSKD
jgi:hypothetical protein